MMHWTPSRPAAAIAPPAREPFDVASSPRTLFGLARADHARMLAHAAKRRRAASGDDGAYWKACAPAAVAKAAAIRTARFARLP